MKSNKRPVVVDLFCGAGGESQGIHWATEKMHTEIEMFAVNHWERAIETHSHNFPKDECICRNIEDINPSRVVPHGHEAFYGLHLLARISVLLVVESRWTNRAGLRHLLFLTGWTS